MHGATLDRALRRETARLVFILYDGTYVPHTLGSGISSRHNEMVLEDVVNSNKQAPTEQKQKQKLPFVLGKFLVQFFPRTF